MAGRFFVVPCTPQNDKEDEMTPKKSVPEMMASEILTVLVYILC